MKLYDKQIEQLQALAEYSARACFINGTALAEIEAWPQSEQETLVLKQDLQLEPGGGACYGVSGLAFTTSEQLVGENRLALIAQAPLDAIPKGTPLHYARFALVRLKPEVDEKSAQALYGLLRKLDYIRYHLNPKGVAMRITAASHKEVLRFSKEAIHQGITLAMLGKTFIQAFGQMDEVEAVQLYFVLLPQLPGQSEDQSTSLFKELDRLALSCEEITESMNVIFKGLNMDCSTCGQKEICDTVEGMRELHEKSSKE